MFENSALIIIDVQEAFEDEKWGERNNPNAEKNISEILQVWRARGLEVIHVRHTSDNSNSVFHPSHRGFNIKEVVKPLESEVLMTKKVNSSFIGTNLENYLLENHIRTVVITGLTTPHCVSTTTRMSGNLGFDTYLISDATAAFGLTDQNGDYFDPETIHNVTLATLHDEFATVMTTEELLIRLSNET